MAILLLSATGHIPEAHRPSQAQLEAGNYRKVHKRFQGFDVTVECPAGSVRSGRDRGGHEWAIPMRFDYGYIKGTLGVDGDHFDVYLGPDKSAPMVYVVTTMAPPDFAKVDEQKAMLGFPSPEAAKEAFLLHYDNPRFFGNMRAMPLEEFREKVETTRDRPRLLKSAVLLVMR